VTFEFEIWQKGCTVRLEIPLVPPSGLGVKRTLTFKVLKHDSAILNKLDDTLHFKFLNIDVSFIDILITSFSYSTVNGWPNTDNDPRFVE
jgi:hypothetical protein